MIDLILIFFISLIIGFGIVLISLILIAYGYVQSINLTKEILVCSFINSLPSRKEKLVNSVQSKLTEELYIKLERISNMSDKELFKREELEEKDIKELRIRINKLLKDRPEYLISTKQTEDMIKATGKYSFFGIFKLLIENCSRDAFEKCEINNYKQRSSINNVDSKKILNDLPNDNDLIRSLI